MTAKRSLPVWTRGMCGPATTTDETEGITRPCNVYGCRYNFLAVPTHCVLDVADEGGMTLAEVGDLLGVSRERIRQLEIQALIKVEAALARRGITREDEKPNERETAYARRLRKYESNVPLKLSKEYEVDEFDDGRASDFIVSVSFFDAPDDDEIDPVVARKVWGMAERVYSITSEVSKKSTASRKRVQARSPHGAFRPKLLDRSSNDENASSSGADEA